MSANNYSLPEATINDLGGIKVGTNLSIDVNGVLSSTDTTYTVTDGELSENNFTDALKSKLDNIAANANALSAGTGVSIDVNDSINIGQDVSITSDVTFNDININGSTTVSGNILPDATNTYDLGSSDKKFKDLHISGSTIFFGDTKMSHDVNNFLHFTHYENSNQYIKLVAGECDLKGNLNLGDNVEAAFGDGSDLKIYHNGSNSYIDDVGTGTLKYRSGTQTFTNADSSKTMAIFNAANSVDLFYNDSKKLETTNTGVSIGGDLTASGNIIPSSSNGAALGTTSLMWSDLFLASGGVINFNNGDMALTHNSSGYTLDLTGASSGGFTCDGDITAFKTSDKRLKDNIIKIENPIEKIKKIGGYNFEWNKLGKENTINNGNDVGVIAQEVEEVLPEATTTRDNGYKAVQYEKIVPLLIECIKEQQSMIENLQGQIDELKK